jgi:hypothetical protein
VQCAYWGFVSAWYMCQPVEKYLDGTTNESK